MNTHIYYIPQYKAVSVIANFAETQKKMDLGMSPKVDYIPMTISDFSRYEIEGIGLVQIENDCFQAIKEIFSNFKFKSVAFHESNIELADVVIDAQHLVIGDRSKVNVSEKNFQNLEEITFLALKTYKGKVLTILNSVKKIAMWYEGKKSNTILSKFPELKELHCFNGSEIQLDIRENKCIERLELANFPKLEHILLDHDHIIKELKIENCKKLDISNLPVTSIWPPRKENIKAKIS
ncbi:hypothetical protein [Chryseobacterium sp. c4a]|uniref:hypothetical protein n=1 Tax=Chryseobacterium sp. c4a TaxID=1573582 RepID=UPI00135B649E|nr:hypothetical protein [Chryseobacterium sp. c4a]